MEPIYKYIFLVLIVISTAPGCETNLDKLPLDQPSDENFFSNEDQLQIAVNGLYTGLWWQQRTTPRPIYLDFSTDFGFTRSGGDGLKTVVQGGGTPETSVFEFVWDDLYTTIGKANNLLDKMSRAQDNVSEEFYSLVEADAKFMRAFSYFWLTELYGDVPLITKVQTLEEAEISRTPKEAVVDQMMDDLDYAISTLPITRSGDNEGKATKGAALALKARIALYNARYRIAAKAAQEVIDLNVYSLYPDYRELFQYEGEGSSEVILDAPYEIGIKATSIPFRQGTRMAGGYSELVPSQYWVDTYQVTDGKPIDESPLYDPAHPFENRDPRLDATIIHDGSTFDGYIFYTNPDSTQTWRIQNGDSTRVENQEVTNPYASFTGYCFRKYLNASDFPRRSSAIDFIYLRYAEVLLTYAEARIENGDIDQSVLETINRVRARAYKVDPSQTSQYPAIKTTNQSKLRDAIRYERTVELAGEGFRFLDMRRWGIAEEVMPGTLLGRPSGGFETIPTPPELDENFHPEYGTNKSLYRHVEERSFSPNRDYLWPIPQKEMDVNPKLEQNPGYSN